MGVAVLVDHLEAVVQAGLPGAVAVASGPGFQYEGAAGLANVETEEPLTVEHRFRVASVTKLFIAATVLQLVDEGALALDDEADAIVPGVTLRQLLNHTSGLPNFDETSSRSSSPTGRTRPTGRSSGRGSCWRLPWNGLVSSRRVRAGRTPARITRRSGWW